ncbi:hypothetical protein TWF281_008481 [Arthrobotrys megalospora]
MMFCHNIPPGAASHLTFLFELGETEEGTASSSDSIEKVGTSTHPIPPRRRFRAWTKALAKKSSAQQAPSTDEEALATPPTSLKPENMYSYNDLELPEDSDVPCRIYLHIADDQQIATLITYKGRNFSSQPDEDISYLRSTIDSAEQCDWGGVAKEFEGSGLHLHFPMAFLRLALDELISGWMFALGHYDQMLHAMRAYSASEPALISIKLGRLVSRLSQINIELATLKAFTWNLQKLHSNLTINVSDKVKRRDALHWEIVMRKFEMGAEQQAALEGRAAVTTQMLLSQAATTDSNSMRVIAIATTLFLPGAFVATFFGSNFKEFSIYQEDITVWLFFVISVPLTGLIMFLILSKWPYMVWVKFLRVFGLKEQHVPF